MSFEYNPIDVDEVKDVEIKSRSDVGIEDQDTSSSNRPTSEQRRKKQIIKFKKDEFDDFHSFSEKLLSYYTERGRYRDKIANEINTPNYIKCKNCTNLRESDEGTPICGATGTIEDNERLYKIIPYVDDIPDFCPSDERWVRFPSDRMELVDEKILTIAQEGYEDYVEEQRRNIEQSDHSELINDKTEYTRRQIESITRGVLDPRDRANFRNSTLRLAWFLHLGDDLQEDYHTQRAEAYLRALDSPFQKSPNIGQGGVDFEENVIKYLKDANFPIYDRCFDIEGVGASYKEMDVHTKLPTGDRAIFEIFTSGSHNDKDIQLQQYADLLEISEGVTPVQLLFSDINHKPQRIDYELFFDLLNTQNREIPDRDPPGDYSNHDASMESEYLGDATSLSYEGFGPEYEPVHEAKIDESKLMARLRGEGYDPSLPVYKSKSGPDYGFCGPTIKLETSKNEHSVILFSQQRTTGHEDIDRMSKESTGEFAYGYEWRMTRPGNWYFDFDDSLPDPVSIIEVGDMDQSLITPRLFDTLLRV